MIEIQNISKQGLKKGDLKQDFTAILWPPLPHLDFHGTQTRSHASAGASFVLCWHHLSHEFCTTFNPARWRDFRKHHPFDRFWAYHVYIVEIWTKIDSIEVEFVSWSTKIIAMSLLISAIQLFRWTWSSCLEKNVCSIMKRPVILKTCQILLYWDCIPAHAWNTDPSFEMQICLIETPWKNPNKGHCSASSHGLVSCWSSPSSPSLLPLVTLVAPGRIIRLKGSMAENRPAPDPLLCRCWKPATNSWRRDHPSREDGSFNLF